MHKAGEEDDRHRRAVVFEEDANGMSKKTARTQLAAYIRYHEYEEGGHDGKIKGSVVAKTLQNLNTLLQVDECDIEAKDVAGETSDPAEPITRVGDGENPMQNEGPTADNVRCGFYTAQSAGHSRLTCRSRP